jgi:glycosyltransferase involved in cell wall biosynthesis
MSTPLLSLLIPTYNRAPLLTQALDAIGRQLHDGNVGEIEIVISDNGSPDETPSVVADFCTAHPSATVRYIRHESNRGADRNVYDLLTLGRGDYQVMLSDDDILLPEAIDRTLAHLRSTASIAAIAWNVKLFENAPEEVGAATYTMEQAELIESQDEALIFLGTMLTFLSALVFRRANLDIPSYEQRIGTSLVQSYLYLDVIASGGGVLCLPQPLLAMRSNNTGGYSFFQVFLTSFNDVLTYGESIGFSHSATRKVLDSHRQFIQNFVLLFKVRGAFGSLVPDYSDGIRRLWQVYRHDPLFLITIIPIMLFPSPLVPVTRRFIRFLRSRRPT